MGAAKPPKNTNLTLRPYQNEAVEQAMRHDGYCLFLEQRTGKTPTALEIIARRNPGRLLIICPKIAIDNVWLKEIRARWGFKPPFELRIIPISSAFSFRGRMKRWKPDMMIVDEGHLIANHQSKQSRAVRTISRHVKIRLLLGGTPIAEGIHKAWAQFDYIDRSIFGKWSDFQNRYLIYGGFGGYRIKGTKRLPEFQRKFHSRVYRITLDEAQGKKTNTPTRRIRFELEESAETYRQMEKEFIAFLNTGTIPVPLAISRIMKLQQIAAGFIIDEFKTEHRVGDEKLRRLGVYILRHADRPTVVFVRFLRDLRRIAALARRLGIPTTEVSASHTFHGFTSGVAIVQVQSGVAIDLSAAKDAIFYTWHYSQAQHDQAKFRIRYFGADEVRYSYLIAKGTVDEELYLSATSKEKFSRLILDKYRRKKNGGQEKNPQSARDKRG